MGYSVLILEDNKTDASLMEQYLKRSRVDFDEIVIVHNKEDYVNALKAHSPDLIISDYRLPDINGSEAIKLKDTFRENTPIIIVSATIGEEKAVELIRNGASDFLIKDNLKDRLAQVAERAIKEAEEKLKRVLAEQNLKLSENKYSLLFESSLDGIIIGIPDKEGKVVDVNPAICDMLGYTRKEMIGLKRRDFVPEQSVKKILDDRKRKGTFKGEMFLKTKDGQLIPVETTSRIVELESGEKRSFSITRDIRKRKISEQKIRKQQDLQLLQKDIAQILNENKPYEESIQDCLIKINDY
jgi:two-component system sensor kinase